MVYGGNVAWIKTKVMQLERKHRMRFCDVDNIKRRAEMSE